MGMRFPDVTHECKNLLLSSGDNIPFSSGDNIPFSSGDNIFPIALSPGDNLQQILLVPTWLIFS